MKNNNIFLNQDERELQFQKHWYIEDVRDFLIPELIKSTQNSDEQTSKDILVSFYRRFARNAGDNNKNILSNSELDLFFDMTKNIASLCDDTLISECKGLPEAFKFFLLDTKYDKKRNLTDDYIDTLPVIRIRSISEYKGQILFEGFIKDYRFSEAGYKPYAEIEIDGVVTEVFLPDKQHFAEQKWFGKTIIQYSTFEYSLEINNKISKESQLDYSLKFFLKQKEQEKMYCHLRFAPPCGKFTPKRRCNYHVLRIKGDSNEPTENKNYRKIMLTFLPESNTIKFGKIKKGTILKNEFIIGAKLLLSKSKLKRKILELGLRTTYFITAPYFKNKKIWLYFDKLYMGGDNGQKLFEYISERDDSPIRHYYIINKDTTFYKDLKAKGYKVIPFNSIKCKLYTLNASLILATHAFVWAFSGLNKFERGFYSNIIKARIVCLQHGLTVQYIPRYQGRIVDNVETYFCASDVEKKNLLLPGYGYDESMIHVTGLPRYDGLKSETKKIILIAPTWRRALTAEGNKMGTSKSYNTAFSNTDFFNIYSKIISNEKLLSKLEKTGYRVIFLLHPTISCQLEDFNQYQKKNIIEIISPIENEGYEKFLKESNLLITDYSGIQFDFAYMNKPILYFHNDKLAPTYEWEVFKYDDMGFGPIIKEIPSLLKQINDNIDNDCIQPDYYADRVQRFFKYTDQSNCMRIFDKLMELYY